MVAFHQLITDISNNGVNSLLGKGGELFLHSVSVDLANNIGREGSIYVLESRCFFLGYFTITQHNGMVVVYT